MGCHFWKHAILKTKNAYNVVIYLSLLSKDDVNHQVLLISPFSSPFKLNKRIIIRQQITSSSFSIIFFLMIFHTFSLLVDIIQSFWASSLLHSTVILHLSLHDSLSGSSLIDVFFSFLHAASTSVFDRSLSLRLLFSYALSLTWLLFLS